MSIITEVVTFSAELTDSYGVEVWQFRKRFEYTVEEARAIAAEILATCDEAQSCIDEDAAAVPTSLFDRPPVPALPMPGPTGRGRNSIY
jgi:hypothetical protein